AAREDLRPTIVAIEPRLGDEHLERSVGHGGAVAHAERPGPAMGSGPLSGRRRSDRQALARLKVRAATQMEMTARTAVMPTPIAISGSPHWPFNSARAA